MEKLVGGFIPVLFGWIGYVHKSRPSRVECEKQHLVVDAQYKAICSKQSAMHEDVREIRDLLTNHIQKNGGLYGTR